MFKFYFYANCDSCRKAMKFLNSRGVEYEKIPIRETPPCLEELKTMLQFLNGNTRKLFNTSGQDYRKMNLKEKILTLSELETLKLLTENGNLVKRPFVLGRDWGIVGFKETFWKEKWDNER